MKYQEDCFLWQVKALPVLLSHSSWRQQFFVSLSFKTLPHEVLIFTLSLSLCNLTWESEVVQCDGDERFSWLQLFLLQFLFLNFGPSHYWQEVLAAMLARILLFFHQFFFCQSCIYIFLFPHFCPSSIFSSSFFLILSVLEVVGLLEAWDDPSFN